MAKAYVPQVVTANDLMQGDVVYLTPAGDWSRDHGDAALARTGAEAKSLLARGAAQADKIVGAYLADAETDADGRPAPSHYREAIRTLGPTFRSDLGKQAETVAAGSRAKPSQGAL